MEFTPAQRQRIAEIAERHHLDLVVLFGSTARGRAHAQSDVDVAVRASSRCDFDVLDAIERDVRAVVGRAADVVDLRTAPPLLAGRIARDGVLLTGDPKAFARLRMELIARHLDFLPFLRFRGDVLRRTFRPRTEPV